MPRTLVGDGADLIQVYLLGGFRVEREKKTIRFATRKVESLFAYLVLHPEPHAREKLAAQFWGDSTDEQSRHSLRTALATLRKELCDDILLADRESIQINPDVQLQVDVREFEQLRTLGDLSALPTLLSFYAGDLLANFYDDWILPERERLRALYIESLLRIAQHHRERGEYKQTIDFARQILTHDPANEKAFQHMLFCMAANGSRIGALQVFEECSKVLHEQLGVEPSPETIALRDQIEHAMTGVSSREATMTNLPNPLTSFVGRYKEIQEIERLFSSTRLLTLTGVGGCGKTRLAIQVARDGLADFKSGVWWAELAPLSDPALVPQSVAQALGSQESGERTFTEILTAVIRDKSMLIVLDNCEHLIAACAELTEKLLLTCPNLKIIATSREALNVTGETAWRVPSLALPDMRHLPAIEELTRYDAIQLFVQRASAIEPNWKFATAGSASAIAQICSRLDGIPLAIELAAARTRGLHVEQIAARLDDRFRLLTGSSRTSIPRQRTLQAAIDWSYKLLSENERKLLSRLSVFAGGWTLQAAEQICSDPLPVNRETPPTTDDRLLATDAMDLLGQLVDKSLVVMENKEGETRYRLYETIRQFAQEKLDDLGEGEAIRDRHLDYFLTFAQGVEPKLHGSNQFVWLELLELDHDNFRQALEWSRAEGRIEKGLMLVAALTWFWDMRGSWNERRERAESLLNEPEAAQRNLIRANALFAAVNTTGWHPSDNKSIRYLQEIVAIGRERGVEGRRALALGLCFLGASDFGTDPNTAEAMVEEGLEIVRSLGDSWVLGILLYVRGFLFMGKKEHKSARKMYNESLTQFRSLGDQYWIRMVSLYLSNLDFKEGEYALARQEIGRTLPLARQSSSFSQVRYATNMLGEIARAEGKYEIAEKLYTEALELARHEGHVFAIAVTSCNAGYVALANGDLHKARTLFAESLALGQKLEDKQTIAFALLGFAGLAAAEKQAQPAIRLLAVADKVLSTDGDKRAVNPADEAELKRHYAIAHEQLDEPTLKAGWEEGRKMTLEEGIEYALKNANPIW